jgi:hypothetical protein
MQHGIPISTVKREISASRWCQLPLDSPSFLIELTYIYTHLRSFTQSRFKLWNPLLLFRYLGAVCSSPIYVYFRPLTLLQTLRRSISRPSAYRLVNGAVIGSLLLVILAVCRRINSLLCVPLWSKDLEFPVSNNVL